MIVIKISIEVIDHTEEEEIRIRCHQVDEEIHKLVNKIETETLIILGYQEDRISRIKISDIYYFEAVDGKVLKTIFTIMVFSFLGALTGIILYTPHAISEGKMRLRVIIHFVFLEALLISLAVLLNLVYGTFVILLLALEIAAVYAIVRLLTYKKDKKEAQKINERLKAFKNEV